MPALSRVVTVFIALFFVCPALIGCSEDKKDELVEEGPCGGAGRQFYCVKSTVTPEGGEAEFQYDLDDVCSSEESLPPECTATRDGNNYAISCDWTFEVAPGCMQRNEWELSGTATDSSYDVSGTITVTHTGPCPPEFEDGTAQIHVEGNRVSGLTAACGDIPGPDQVTLTITTPGGDVTPTVTSAVAYRNPSNDTAVIEVELVSGSSTSYFLGFVVPNTPAPPVTYPAVCDPLENEVKFVYLELEGVSSVERMCEGGAGTFRVASMSASRLSGHFSISGQTNQSSKDRTLKGGVNLPLYGQPFLGFQGRLQLRTLIRTMLRTEWGHDHASPVAP